MPFFMHQEFPKCLIRGEESKVVFDAIEEKSVRADGFYFHSDEKQEKASTAPIATEPKRRGRPPKGE